LACREAGIVVTLPKPITSGIEARGRFGKQHFVYLSDGDVYRCPASGKLKYHYTNEAERSILKLDSVAVHCVFAATVIEKFEPSSLMPWLWQI